MVKYQVLILVKISLLIIEIFGIITLHIFYYYVIDTNQYEDFIQVFCFQYSVRNYWLNRLNIAINSVPKYGDMSENLKISQLYIISYSNPQYLGTAYFE